MVRGKDDSIVKRFKKEFNELNIIISGHVLIQDGPLKKSLVSGHIFEYDIMEKSEVEFIENTTLVVVKTPSLPGDKHFE